MNRPNIGIIGMGYVGSSIAHGFSLVANIKVYDINPILSQNTLEETIRDSKYIFICLPTPMKDNGEADISIIDDTLNKINKMGWFPRKIFIIKSTIPPKTTLRLKGRYPRMRIIHNPEFLTARNAKLDFINSSRIILGGNKRDTKEVKNLYRMRFPTTPIIETDSTTAEIVKYACNAFFSCKVSFLNEIYDICKALNCDYNEVKGMMLLDQRIGNSHMDIPGHDGDRGWGGSCFPKDINAFIQIAKQLNISPLMLLATWEKNLEVRKKRDWE